MVSQFLRRLFAVFLLGIGFSGSILAQSVTVEADRDSVLVGEPFTLTVSASYSQGQRVVFPSAPGVVGDFELLEIVTNTGNSAAGDQSQRTFIDYRAVTFALDSAYVEGFPVGVVAGTDTSFATSPPFLMPVISVVPDDAAGIRDIQPIAEFPSSWLNWLYAFIGLLLGLGIAYYLYRRFWKKDEAEEIEEKPVIVINPYLEARNRLDELEKTDLHDPESIHPFYVDLSETLRTYLEQETGIPALEHTTNELVSILRDRRFGRIINSDLCDRTQTILELSDLAKFADYKPDAETGGMALANTRYIVDEVHTRVKPAEDDHVVPKPVDSVALEDLEGDRATH